MQACRDSLHTLDLQMGSHAGLLLARFLKVAVPGKREADKQHPEARKRLHEAARSAAASAGAVYSLAFERWQNGLPKEPAPRCLLVQGRLIVGLGGDNVLETGITLQHTYGVPIVPGSALKGLAAHYAHQVWGAADARWKKDAGEYHRTIFGTQDDAGTIVFHDAWITPDSLSTGGRSGLVLDVMTPHHSGYYSGPGSGESIPPTDFDDPNPIAFLSVAGVFLVAVSCDVQGEKGVKWAALALDLLTEALREWGVGGKTSSGYGRLVEQQQTTSRAETPRGGPRPRYRPGQAVMATRVADPKDRGRAWFEADDGFAGTVVGSEAPRVEIGERTNLEVAATLSGGYNFRLPRQRSDGSDQRRRQGARPRARERRR